MSKLSDYSKFDHLVVDDDDDDDDDDDNDTTTPLSSLTKPTTAPGLRHVRKPSATSCTHNRLRFLAQYQGRTVYEWEQSLNEVIIYIVSPLGTNNNNNTTNNNNTDAKIVCQISATHLKVGIQSHSSVAASTNDNDYYIDEDTYHPIDTKESTWCLEEEESKIENGPTNQHSPPQKIITIYLQKVAKGLVWDAPLRGHASTSTLDPPDRHHVQQALLLERWQEENPGLDFRDATFSNGSLPDPRTYMGGIGYQ